MYWNVWLGDPYLILAGFCILFANKRQYHINSYHIYLSQYIVLLYVEADKVLNLSPKLNFQIDNSTNAGPYQQPARTLKLNLQNQSPKNRSLIQIQNTMTLLSSLLAVYSYLDKSSRRDFFSNLLIKMMK